MKRYLVLVFAALALIVCLVPKAESIVTIARQVNSLSFPVLSETNNKNEILNEYPQYLRFVLDVARTTDRASASKLESTYRVLRAKYPEGAARFLKGLRFELVNKLEFMGISPSKVSSQNPEFRRMITKYTKIWHREADEYLLRSIAIRSEKNIAY